MLCIHIYSCTSPATALLSQQPLRPSVSSTPRIPIVCHGRTGGTRATRYMDHHAPRLSIHPTGGEQNYAGLPNLTHSQRSNSIGQLNYVNRTMTAQGLRTQPDKKHNLNHASGTIPRQSERQVCDMSERLTAKCSLSCSPIHALNNFKVCRQFRH